MTNMNRRRFLSGSTGWILAIGSRAPWSCVARTGDPRPFRIGCDRTSKKRFARASTIWPGTRTQTAAFTVICTAAMWRSSVWPD